MNSTRTCPVCGVNPMPDPRTTNKSVCHKCDKARERRNNPAKARLNRQRDTERERFRRVSA